MWFNKTKSYLGVDLGAGGVKIVELREEKKRPVLFTYGYTLQAQDVHRLLPSREKQMSDLVESKDVTGVVKSGKPQEKILIDESRVGAYAAALKAVCAKAKTISKVAVGSLPVSAVFHAIVTMPVVKKEDFERIVRAEVKKLLPYPLEEMVLDIQKLSDGLDGKSGRVVVNAVPKALVSFYSKVFKQAGLELDSLEPESVALARSLIGRDTATTLLVDIGAERTNFFIVDKAVPITHHSIELGGQRINKILETNWGIEAEMVEQAKRDLFGLLITNPSNPPISREKFLELFNPIVEPIAKEIEYSLELYLRQSENENKRAEKVILTGGGALFPYLSEYIADKFKLKCYIGDPWGRVVYQEGLKPILRSIAPRMSVAIGLALRNVV